MLFGGFPACRRAVVSPLYHCMDKLAGRNHHVCYLNNYYTGGENILLTPKVKAGHGCSRFSGFLEQKTRKIVEISL